MTAPKDKIGMVIYANPDYYPPAINAIQILAKEFDTFGGVQTLPFRAGKEYAAFSINPETDPGLQTGEIRRIDLVVICRNQDKPHFNYPQNVRLYRLGKLKTSREKEKQNFLIRMSEYITFLVCAVWLIRFYRCRLIYIYDMYGFIGGILASYGGKKIPLIYHNLELAELRKTKNLAYLVKYLELRLVHYADRIIFPDINRARFFKDSAGLKELPQVVFNTPLRITQLPANRLSEVLEKRGFGNDAQPILYQGSINEGHCLLEIIQSMVYWPKNAVLVLSGFVFEDFLKEIYRKAKELNIFERIVTLSFMPYGELSSYTVGAYLGLALVDPPDINQYFVATASNKIFEYLSVGVPIITNDEPHFRTALDSSIAYFTRADSPEDIGRAVNAAFSNIEEHHKKSEAARQMHLTRFNYQEQFQPTLEFIRRELAKRR